MMKTVSVLLALVLTCSVSNAQQKSGYSGAVMFKMLSGMRCNAAGDDEFLAEVSYRATEEANLKLSGTEDDWRQTQRAERGPPPRPGGGTSRRSLMSLLFGTDEDMEYEEDYKDEERNLEAVEEEEEEDLEAEEKREEFMDILHGASAGHRRLCDHTCRSLCHSTKQDYWCSCCSCCSGRRRRSLMGYARRLFWTEMALVAHDAAEAAVRILEEEEEKGELSRIPACLDPDYNVQVYFEDGADPYNSGSGISKAYGKFRGRGGGRGGGRRGGRGGGRGRGRGQGH